MSTGLKLRITNTTNGVVVDRSFTQFPVRIGRNTLNDLCIVDRFVSQFHAVVEVRDRELMLRDLGSSNGTKLEGTRAPAHELTPLGPHKNVFGIGPLLVHAELAEVDVYEEPVPASLGLDAPVDSEGVLEHSFITSVNDTIAFNDPAFAAARAQFAAAEAEGKGKSGPPVPVANMSGTLILDPEGAGLQRDAVMAKIAAHQANLARAQAGQVATLPPSSAGDAKQRRLEQLALQGVREIAKALLPNSSALEEPEDLVRFLSKLRDTTEVFLRSFIPLRDGYRQFASQMHIQRSTGGMSVETATNEHDLAEHLLDWRDKGREAHKAIEGTFADLMIHQLALLHAIMRGVKSLLDALSPKAMDVELGELEKQGKANFMWGPWRFKELWRVYTAKHGDMDDGDKRMFSALFGNDFAESYTQYRSMVDVPDDAS